MAVSFVAVNNAIGQSTGSVAASTCAIAATLPAGTASGDRVFTLQAQTIASAASPSGWTPLFKDRVIGSGAAALGSGQRFESCHYRDYDGVWSMPANWPLTSAANNSHNVAVVTLRKGASEVWDTPTESGPGNDFGTPNTSFSATTPATFATVVGALVIVHCLNNDDGRFSSQAMTGTNGFAHGGVSERTDGGSTTGFTAPAGTHTLTVTTAASPAGTLTFTATLGAASEGGASFIQQTVSPATNPGLFFQTFPQ